MPKNRGGLLRSEAKQSLGLGTQHEVNTIPHIEAKNMKIWNAVSLLVVGAIAAMGQIMWVHGDENRLGDYAFDLAFVFVLLPFIVDGIVKRYRAWAAARAKAKKDRMEAARVAAEQAEVRRFHRREEWRGGLLDAINE